MGLGDMQKQEVKSAGQEQFYSLISIHKNVFTPGQYNHNPDLRCSNTNCSKRQWQTFVHQFHTIVNHCTVFHVNNTTIIRRWRKDIGEIIEFS